MVLSSDLPNSTLVRNIQSSSRSTEGHKISSYQRPFRHQSRSTNLPTWGSLVQVNDTGTNWRSKAFYDRCYKNLKYAGLPDRIAWEMAALELRPWMDINRVGIYGSSAGGQSAMGALLWHGNFYKAAVAGCGCHDNRMDKIRWNE